MEYRIRFLAGIVTLSMGLVLALGCGNEDGAEPGFQTQKAPSSGIRAPQGPMPSVHAIAALQTNSKGLDEAPIRPGELESAIKAALREPDALVRASTLSSLLLNLGPEFIPEVKALLGDFWFDLGWMEDILLVTFWANYEPAEAARWASYRSRSAHRDSLMLAAIEVWARQDPLAAAEQVDILIQERGAESASAQLGLIHGWFESGVPGLEDFVRDIASAIEQQRSLSSLTRTSVKRYGPEVSMRWAEAIPDAEDPRFKLAVYRRLGAELALWDPAAAVAWCEAQCNGPYGTTLLDVIARRWAFVDGPAAMAWLSTREPGIERDRAVVSSFSAWFRRDNQDLFRWIEETAGDGFPPWLEPAMGTYVNARFHSDPQAAMDLADKIKDPEARRQSYVATGIKWINRDPEAAEAWLEQSPLSEEMRERVRSKKK